MPDWMAIIVGAVPIVGALMYLERRLTKMETVLEHALAELRDMHSDVRLFGVRIENHEQRIAVLEHRLNTPHRPELAAA